MYLNAFVHCFFCHPHSDRSLGNRSERQLDVNDTALNLMKTTSHLFIHQINVLHINLRKGSFPLWRLESPLDYQRMWSQRWRQGGFLEMHSGSNIHIYVIALKMEVKTYFKNIYLLTVWHITDKLENIYTSSSKSLTSQFQILGECPVTLIILVVFPRSHLNTLKNIQVLIFSSILLSITQSTPTPECVVLFVVHFPTWLPLWPCCWLWASEPEWKKYGATEAWREGER